MKWQTILILSIWMTSGNLWIEEGGSNTGDRFFVQARNPFFEQFLDAVSEAAGVSPAAHIGVNITYPINGTTYYTSTRWLNITIYGDGTPPYTCWYKTTGAWNAYNCENQTVTFPTGLIPLQVWVQDSNTDNGYGYGYFTIYERIPGGVFYDVIPGILFAGALLIWFIIIFDDRRLRQKKGKY